jgi:uncharacterized protein
MTMLKRAAYESLRRWKNESKRKVLLIDGARQIGKTYLIEEFARAEYESYVKIDFLDDSGAAALFAGARSASQVAERVLLYSGRPRQGGKTLVFFDEVQKAQNIVTLSKYLLEDDRFDFVMSGSMLGVELTQVKSFPVGYMDTIRMYPLSFREFCWSQNVPAGILEEIDECYSRRKPVDEGLHSKLIDLFRLYLVVGGMPEAVQKYIDTRSDLGAVREAQTQIVQLYREDIAKYAADRVLQVKAIFDELPNQLAKENKRFQLKSLRDNGRFAQFANDFAWLVGAKAALKTVNVKEPKFMLARTEEQARFKLYSSDCGMLASRYPLAVAADILIGSKSVNYGAVYENYVAQELAAAGVKLRYYHNSGKGEVDFIAETHAAQVVPIEVKSGKDYKVHSALNNLLSTQEFNIPEAVVFSEGNVEVRKKQGKCVVYLPLYMVGLLADELNAENASYEKAPARGFCVAPPTW